MDTQSFYAVRITLTHEYGDTTTRVYVRGEQRMGRQKFAAWALGDLLTLTMAGHGTPVKWEIVDVTPDEAYEDRRRFARF